MSRMHEAMVTCPDCGKESSFTVWDSVNTMLDPELKEKVINGELFCFTCPVCGAVTNVVYDILYHQMEDGIMIFCSSNEESIKTTEEFFSGKLFSGLKAADDIIKFFKKSQNNYLYRIVSSQNRLREKIRIFNDGKDDRIIELMKTAAMASLLGQHPEMKDCELYYDGDKNHNIFAIIAADGTTAQAELPEEVYEEMSEAFGDRLPDIRDNDDFEIDFDWATHFLGLEY